MSVNRLKHGSNLRLVLLVLWLVCYVCYGQFEDTNDFNNPAVLPLVTQMVYRSLSNSTAALNQELATRAKFCVKDPYAFLCFVSLLLSKLSKEVNFGSSQVYLMFDIVTCFCFS